MWHGWSDERSTPRASHNGDEEERDKEGRKRESRGRRKRVGDEDGMKARARTRVIARVRVTMRAWPMRLSACMCVSVCKVTQGVQGYSGASRPPRTAEYLHPGVPETSTPKVPPKQPVKYP
jgi:hypothetical protein